MSHLPVIGLFVILFSSFAEKGYAQPDELESHTVPENFCITREEYRLYRLINEFRKENGQEIIPISRTLSYVARAHVLDLHHNSPDTSFCSLSSWSDKGTWTPCCHSKLTPNPKCILGKPSELTGYSGEGHELCYWDNLDAAPDSILQFFSTLPQSADLLLNRSKWSYYQWKAMGIAIYKHYASIWFGEVTDTENEPVICQGKGGFVMDFGSNRPVKSAVDGTSDRLGDDALNRLPAQDFRHFPSDISR